MTEVPEKSRHDALRNWNSKKTENTFNSFLILRRSTSKLIRQIKGKHEKDQLLDIQRFSK